MLRTRLLLLFIGIMLLGMAPASATAQEGRVEAGGAPPAGSGPFELPGFVRVIDGDSLDVYLAGRRTAVGLLGLAAPQGNTACGRTATGQLQRLLRGGVRLEEDPTLTFDARGRRLYYAVTRDGRSVAQAMAAAGVARSDGRGREQAQVAAAEAQASAAKLGCVAGGTAAAEAPLAAAAAGEAGAAAPDELAALAISLPPGFTADVVASGLTFPTAAAFLPDGRILIAEKAGLVRLVKDGVLQATPFLDLRSQVNDYWDRGLLGLAVDPNFATNGWVYLFYPHEHNPGDYVGPKSARLIRVRAVGDSASFSSAEILLGRNVGPGCGGFPAGADCIPNEWYGHSVGALRFASDSTLFATMGDASNWNIVVDDALRAQDPDILVGKVLRITTSGQGVPGNPFWSGDPSANRSKVWSRGVRNAFRFGLRPGSDLPYLGDVGWNTWEEISVARAGSNLGWPCYEGSARQAGYEPKPVCQALYSAGGHQGPLVEWVHVNQASAAAVGGAFYTGTAYPAAYQGAFFYADYGQNWLRTLRTTESDGLVSGPSDFATAADAPVDIIMGPDQHLYYVSIATGELRRLRYGAAAPPPPPPPGGTTYVSDLTPVGSPTNGWGPIERDTSNGEAGSGDGRPLTINGATFAKGLGVHAVSEVRYTLGGSCTTFSAQVGIDDEVGALGSVVFEVWADGVRLYASPRLTGADAAVPVSVAVGGRSELSLRVLEGGDGNPSDHADWADARLTCGTNQPPVATITAPDGATRVKVGDVVSYSGTASDPEEGVLPPDNLSWQVILHHCPGGNCHVHPFLSSTGASGSFTVPDHGDQTYFELRLTARDSSGGATTTSLNIQPQTVRITLATNPPGLQVALGGETLAAPFTRETIAGSRHTITAPTPQGEWVFAGWSDGGPAQHDVTVGTADVTYTATFTRAGGPGTEPPPGPAPGAGATRWYFAEGYTGTGFDEYLTIQNPGAAGTATITYYVEGGTPVVRSVPLAGSSRTTVAVHQEASPGNPGGLGRLTAGHSTRVESNVPIIVERPMYFTYGGSVNGGHNVLGATAPGTTWAFAEGYTGAGFDEYLTIMNPGAAGSATITYYVEGQSTPLVRNVPLAANSRTTVAVHTAAGEGNPGGLGRLTVGHSTKVDSSVPVVVERPMYFRYAGAIDGGHNVLGATAFGSTWAFAEGYTGAGFDEYLTIMNPGAAGSATITYYVEGGAPQTRSLSLAPNSRTTVVVHGSAADGGLGRLTTGHSTTVTSTVPVAVERPMYFTYGNGLTDGHNVLGASRAAAAWYFAEGYTGAGFDEYLTIQNPNAAVGSATITYYVEGGAPQTRSLSLAPNSRTTVAVHDAAAAGLGRLTAGHSTAVTSTLPVVVERPMYFTYAGNVTGGHNVLGFAP